MVQHGDDENHTTQGIVKIQALFRRNRIRDLMRDNKLYCPHVATKTEVSKAMINLTELTDNDIFLDIGCGEGAVLNELLIQTNIKHAIGIEIDDMLAKTASRILSIVDPNLERVKIICDDIMNQLHLLSETTVIFIYLLPSYLQWLSPLLKTYCKPGTRICTYEFCLPSEEWTSDMHIQTSHHLLPDSTRTSTLYLYTIPTSCT